MLESSLSRIKGSLGNADTDPDLECIRDDPRFQKILADAKKAPRHREQDRRQGRQEPGGGRLS